MQCPDPGSCGRRLGPATSGERPESRCTGTEQDLWSAWAAQALNPRNEAGGSVREVLHGGPGSRPRLVLHEAAQASGPQQKVESREPDNAQVTEPADRAKPEAPEALHRGALFQGTATSPPRSPPQAFKTFEHMAQQDEERRQREMEEKMKEEEEAAAERTKVPPAAQEVEIESTAEQASAPRQGPCTPEETAETAPSTAASELPEAMVPTEPQPPQLPMRQEQFQTDPDSYNGAVRENYAWSQDYSDLEIKVPVPEHIVKGKQVAVEIGSSWVRVALQEGNGQRVLVEGKLTHRINTENSLWSLEPGKCVLINLSKGDEYWWNAILEGEEPIDIDKINKERSMATVDEEEHAVLDRLTFDYHQKLQGKPQSHELKVHEMLKKGWDAEGSPFRGQKFDPSMFNISPGAVQF